LHHAYSIAKQTATAITSEPEDAEDTIAVTAALVMSGAGLCLLIACCTLCAIRRRIRRARIGTPSAKPPRPLPQSVGDDDDNDNDVLAYRQNGRRTVAAPEPQSVTSTDHQASRTAQPPVMPLPSDGLDAYLGGPLPAAHAPTAVEPTMRASTGALLPSAAAAAQPAGDLIMLDIQSAHQPETSTSVGPPIQPIANAPRAEPEILMM
jgi:hypothetical protein